MTDTQKTARKTAWDVIGIELAVDLRPDAHKELLDRIARAIMDERKRCAKVARYGCLVPPDGGAPTEDERLMCERIELSIMEGWKP